MIWWLVFNLIFWIGGWKICQIVLIEVFARLFESGDLMALLRWLVALLLAMALVAAAPVVFVLPVWLIWIRDWIVGADQQSRPS